jgi:hypothetical protein
VLKVEVFRVPRALTDNVHCVIGHSSLEHEAAQYWLYKFCHLKKS